MRMSLKVAGPIGHGLLQSKEQVVRVDDKRQQVLDGLSIGSRAVLKHRMGRVGDVFEGNAGMGPIRQTFST